MRLAILSDIHGNHTAFEAVLADLRQTAPDLVFHGGDLADGGSSPREIVDRIRDLGWKGVAGNTDEMLFRTESLAEFATHSPHLHKLFDAIGEMAVFSRNALGKERIDWLKALPREQMQGPITLVHASPGNLWRAPAASGADEEFERTYREVKGSIVIYGHVHVPFVRKLSNRVFANSGSVGLPYDGDPRASYLLLDDHRPTLRRVEYDIDGEIKLLSLCGLPHADWAAKMLRTARFEMP